MEHFKLRFISFADLHNAERVHKKTLVRFEWIWIYMVKKWVYFYSDQKKFFISIFFIFIFFYIHNNCNEKNYHATSWPTKFWEINIYRNTVFRSRSLTGWFCIPASEVQRLKVIELKDRKRRCRSSTWSLLPFCCTSVQLEAQSNLSVSVTRYTEHRYSH